MSGLSCANWNSLPFTEAVADETGGNRKVLQRDYLSAGTLPVVDQGKGLIAGYTNDESAACNVELPVVLFGDHTKEFKFVDFPFALGADGVKVLKPATDLDEKFLYHYLKQVRLPGNAGYSRHFKFLKRERVPLPPLPEQKRIAAILDKADEIRRKRQEAIRLTEELLRSAFLEMFGDPVTNPKGWEVRRLGEVGVLDRGRSRHRPRNDPALLDGPYPLIQTGDVANCDGEVREFSQSYSELGLQQSRMWPKGTLCITIAANIAKVGVLTFDACFPDSVVGFVPGRSVTTEFVQSWMQFLQPALEAQAPHSAQKNINLQILSNLLIPVPPTDSQMLYARLVRKAWASRTRALDQARDLQWLRVSLELAAFTGRC